MRKFALVLLAAVTSLIIFSSVAGAEQAAVVDVSGRALNSTPIVGPEGIILGADDGIYAGGHDGKIYRILPSGKIEEIADLNNLPGDRKETISAIGLAMDGEGDIYAAALDFDDGSVLKVVGPGKPDSGKVTLFRRGIGMANFVLIDRETGMMYVSDSRMFSGGVYKFEINDETRLGAAADAEKELLGEFAYANGLALGPEKEWLYVAETTRGRISRVNLKDKSSEVFAELGGWTDGITFDPARRLIFACDNRGGRIMAVDLSGKIAGEAYVRGKEGQCAPASLILRDPATIVFTDLWKAGLLRALFGRPQYHSFVYELPVDEVLK